MKASAALLVTVASLAGATVQAGYSGLNRELEGYEPPALYRAQVSAKPDATAPAAPSASEAEFQSQLARIRDLGSRWERALGEAAPQGAFYVPDASRVEALRPAAADAAAAKKALADGFSLETLETLALLRSPSVQAKELELRAALEGYSQVENLDSILRRYSVFTASLMAGVGGAESPDAPALNFPFPGVLALKGEVVTQELRAAQEQLEAARRDAVTGARKMYWDLAFVQSSQEITGQMRDLLENLKSATSARYEAGETTFQDVVRVGIEREKVREELVTMSNERHHMHAGIAELLNLPAPAHFGPALSREPAAGVPDVAPLYPVAREKRQELRALRATLAKMERMLEMAETMIYPGFSLGLSAYERDEVSRVGGGAGMGADAGSFATSTSASMGAGLPKMPWFGKDDAYLREARHRIEAMKSELQMAEAAADYAVHDAWVRLDKATREEALYRDRVLPLSRAALEAATRGYSAGKVMFSDLIESYAGWLEASRGAERARSDRGIARAELEAAAGTELP